MANKRQQDQNGQDRDQAVAGDATDSQRMEHLQRSFAKFRRTHQPHTRIPQALRDAALLALRCGIPESEVCRACGISSAQLMLWRQSQSSGRQRCGPEQQMVRVFPVVDELTEIPIERSSVQEGQSLSLSIGGWDICIRRNDE